MKYLLRTALLLLFVTHLCSSSAFSQIGEAVPYQSGVVSSTDIFASETGIEILTKGGNAVDAAIAVQFVLAVTVPRAGNIGGGGFMMVHLEDGSVKALDFREKAPINASRDMFLDENGEYIPERSRVGGLASGVPGTVDGMISALERHGTLPLEVIMEPAIRLAHDGFPLTHSMAQDLNNRVDEFSQFEASKEYFTKADGSLWKAGDLFVQNELAETLERIARQGRDGFYSGITARLIVQEMQKTGGIITLRDLRNYRSTWRDPIESSFSGHNFYMMPPPSSGGIVIQQILKMIEIVGVENLDFNSAEYIHLLAEAMRRSFADRNYYLGDPDFVDIPLSTLMSSDYLSERISDFNPIDATSSEDISYGQLEAYPERAETTHFSVVDKNGMAVAVTTTLNGSFGSFVSVNGAGFLMNNEMDDFSAKPGEPNMFGLIGAEANAVEPEKRMLSSMSPTIVTKDGSIRMIAGGAGGPRIITATLQNILNVLLFDMNAEQAINAPRFHHQWLPDRLSIEPLNLSPDTQALLRSMGHEIHVLGNIGRTHIIILDDEGNRYGAADPRGDGAVRGY